MTFSSFFSFANSDKSGSSKPSDTTVYKPAKVEVTGLEEDPIDSPPVPWMHGAAGIASGAVSMYLFYPLDFLRTRMHTWNGKGTRTDGIRETIRQEGMKGMYRGVGVAVGSHALGWGMYLTCFREAQRALEGMNGGTNVLCDFTAACSAATVTSTIVTPLNLLKVRTQLAKQSAATSSGAVAPLPKGIFRGLRHIAATEGTWSLFRGVGPQILLSSHTTIQVALYEAIRRQMWGDDADAPVGSVVTASAVSKSCASFLSNPLEVARTRLQDQRNTGTMNYSSMTNAFGTLWREEGLRGLYRGAAVNMCRVVPTTVCAFVIYESAINMFKHQAKRRALAERRSRSATAQIHHA